MCARVSHALFLLIGRGSLLLISGFHFPYERGERYTGLALIDSPAVLQQIDGIVKVGECLIDDHDGVLFVVYAVADADDIE